MSGQTTVGETWTRLLIVLFIGACFLGSSGDTAADPVPGDCPGGMTAYWSFDESSAPYADFKGDHDGSCGSIAGCPSEVPGKIEWGQAFDRTSGTGVDIDGVDFNWSKDDSFSIEFWMKKAGACPENGGVDDNEVIVGRDSADSDMQWWVGVNCFDTPRGRMSFYLVDTGGGGNSGTLYAVTGAKIVTDNRWHHVAAVKTGAEIRLYVDGSLEGSTGTAYSYGFDDATAPVTLGYLGGAFRYTGLLDEVAIYDTALTLGEVRSHYYLARNYCAACLDPVAIMPLGDSITFGWSSGAECPLPDCAGVDESQYAIAYRKTLWDGLNADLHKVDFVGGEKGGELYEGFDPDNEGHNGLHANHIAGSVSGWLDAYKPEVILLHVGTNDISLDWSSDNVATTVNDVSNILDAIDAYDEDATVVLARIVNRACTGSDPNCAAKSAATTQFNQALRTMADARVAAGDKLIVVDMESALNYAVQPDGDMYTDGLHPYQTGYDKMAQVWLDALDFLPACAPAPAAITSTPRESALVGRPYTYRVQATGNPAPTFSLDEYPEGMAIDGVTGVISWMPTDAGDFYVAVRAENDSGPDTQEFTITVENAPPCTAGMISYWNLDETSGTVFQDAYDGNDGACQGTGCPQAVDGVLNGARQLNGTSTKIDVPSSPAFAWGKDDSFSIEFWIKKSTACTGGAQVAVGREDNGGPMQWWVGCWQESDGVNNAAGFALFDADTNDTGETPFLAGTTNLADGEWHHVVAVRDGVAKRNFLYVDGVEEASVDVTYSAGFGSNREVNIGWLNTGSGFHIGGILDEVAVYGVALSPEQVAEHYVAVKSSTGYCHEPIGPSIIDQPKSQTVSKGSPALFQVLAGGSPTLSYQWKKNGTDLSDGGNIGGSQTSQLTVSPVTEADAGSYTCWIQNPVLGVMSGAATLTVIVPPVITGQPSSVTKNQGETATFSVTADGTSPSYQWLKDGTPLNDGGNISGSKTSTLTIDSVTAGDAGEYTCHVSNAANVNGVTSGAAMLTVIVPPVITGQPSSVTRNQGQTATFSVTATGTSPSYQWRKNGSDLNDGGNISGSKTSTLTIDSVTAGDEGSYTCHVSNAANVDGVTSEAASLTVIVPPEIVQDPQSRTVKAGEQVVFAVTATGTDPSYRWMKDGVDLTDGANIQGAGTATLTILSAGPGDQGVYSCRATNDAGSDTSAGASLTLEDSGIVISMQPASVAVIEGYGARFSVRATGPRGARLTYQWLKNGLEIPGAGRSMYQVKAAAAADDGARYQCRITNSVSGSWVMSDAAILTVTPILITAQPRDVTAAVGKTARFSIRAKGPKGAKLLYQWYKNGLPLPGETRSTLNLKGIVAGDDGAQIVCTVSASNGAGPLPSNPATLTVLK